MKYIPSQGQHCKLCEIHTLTQGHMKYTPLQGKLHEIQPVNYMKYIPLQGQYTPLSGTTL